MNTTTSSEGNLRFVLRNRPTHLLDPDTLELLTGPIPVPGPGEVLIRSRYLGIDPTTRAGMAAAATYEEPMVLGEVVRGLGVGEVIDSNGTTLPAGTFVLGYLGWQEWCALPAAGVHPVPPGIEPQTMLSVYGAAGLAAYFGVTEVADVQSGEVVVVSSAAGTVGAIAGQLARLRGARVIGIAGDRAKCEYVVGELGFDVCLDRTEPDLAARLAGACPDGVDVYFDNVGGPVLSAALSTMKVGGRVVMCGGISSYLAEPPGPGNLIEIVQRRLTVRGFLVLDYLERIPEAVFALAGWVANGDVRYHEELIDGLAEAPAALNRLFTGQSIGKSIVHLGVPAQRAAPAVPAAAGSDS